MCYILPFGSLQESGSAVKFTTGDPGLHQDTNVAEDMRSEWQSPGWRLLACFCFVDCYNVWVSSQGLVCHLLMLVSHLLSDMTGMPVLVVSGHW